MKLFFITLMFFAVNLFAQEDYTESWFVFTGEDNISVVHKVEVDYSGTTVVWFNSVNSGGTNYEGVNCYELPLYHQIILSERKSEGINYYIIAGDVPEPEYYVYPILPFEEEWIVN